MNYKQMLEAFELLGEQLELIRKQLDNLDRRIRLLEPVDRGYQKPVKQLGCFKCGLGSDGAMGYVCSRHDCPTKVTCVA